MFGEPLDPKVEDQGRLVVRVSQCRSPAVFETTFCFFLVPPRPPEGPEGGSGMPFSFRGRGFGLDRGVVILIFILTLSAAGGVLTASKGFVTISEFCFGGSSNSGNGVAQWLPSLLRLGSVPTSLVGTNNLAPMHDLRTQLR